MALEGAHLKAFNLLRKPHDRVPQPALGLLFGLDNRVYALILGSQCCLGKGLQLGLLLALLEVLLQSCIAACLSGLLLQELVMNFI